MRVSSLAATVSVAAFILLLRERVLRRRADAAKKFPKSTILPRPDVPLSREEVGWVWEFWRGKFNEQVEIRRQAARDIGEDCKKQVLRKGMHSPWCFFSNRKLGIALITFGFNVNLHVLAHAYAKLTADGDAPSLPNPHLRRRKLAAIFDV